MKEKQHIFKIVEKGIPLENVPDTYLSKRKKEVEKNKTYSIIFKEILEMLKEMNWQDIEILEQGEYKIPIFPEEVREKIKEAFNNDLQKAKGDLMRGSLAFAKTYRNDNPDTGNSIHLRVDHQQRSHFPNEGIPSAIRGTNLGYKLYRALLEKSIWLTSNEHGTVHKDWVWQSIISPKTDKRGRPTADDVHAIVGPNYVFAMIKTIPTADKIKYAKKFLNRLGEGEINSITTTNFAIDDELKSILPQDVKDMFTPEDRAQREQRRAQERFDRYAPFGLDAHNWEIGDYIVVKEYLLQINYSPLPVRKVVEKKGSEWIALKMTDLPAYERTGTINDPRMTSRKTGWVKSQLQPGDVDPTAGRLAVKGSAPSTPREESSAGEGVSTEMSQSAKRMVKNFMRANEGEFMIYVTADDWNNRRRNNSPMAAWLIKRIGTGRRISYYAVNSRTSESKTMSRAEFNDAELVKLNWVELEHKSNVTGGDFVFVKDHRSSMGLVCKVQRITPAANQHTGIYIYTGEPRPLYIREPSTLLKLTEARSNESLNLFRFKDFLSE